MYIHRLNSLVVIVILAIITRLAVSSEIYHFELKPAGIEQHVQHEAVRLTQTS